MKTIHLIICAAFSLIFKQCLSANSYSASFAGPYDVVIKEIAQCKTSKITLKNALRFTTRITKFNRTTYVYDGVMAFPRGITPDVKVLFEFATWGNGGWKPLFGGVYGELCESMFKYAPDDYSRAIDTLNTTEEIKTKVKNCACPPGVYHVQNFVLDARLKGVPVLPYGKFRLDASFYWKDRSELVGCMRGFMDVVPRGTGAKG